MMMTVTMAGKDTEEDNIGKHTVLEGTLLLILLGVPSIFI